MPYSKIDGDVGASGVEQVLGVKGVEISPQLLDTSLVKFVYETSQFGKYEDIRPASYGFTMTGSASKNRDLVGPHQGNSLNLANDNCRVLAIGSRIGYNAAGAAADNGNLLQFRLWLEDLNGDDFPIASKEMTVATAQLSYELSLSDIGTEIIVPKDTKLVGQIENLSGNFSAAATWYFDALLEVRKRGLAL